MSCHRLHLFALCFFFQAEDGIRDYKVTGVQTCALPISSGGSSEYYLTVSELRAHPAYDQDVRVAGVVQNDVLHPPGPPGHATVQFTEKEIGRASCRERV